MPGSGKGRWFRLNAKTTVEQSLKLSIKHFRTSFRTESTRTLTWSRREVVSATIRYAISLPSGTPRLTLAYRWRETEDILLPVPLESTPTHFGGLRWWYTCPLSLNGVACNRRVGTLYLPPGARYFGCRPCYRLTYCSSQEAHQNERAFCLLTGGHGFDRELYERFMARMRGER